MLNILAGKLMLPVLLAIDLSGVAKACAVVGGTGLLIGIMLGIAGKILSVKEDEKALAVREYLPGNNCGGCGYAGCDALSKAIAEGIAPADACPVADSKSHAAIAEVMGQEVSQKEKMTAFVKCSGTCDKAGTKYEYYGVSDCRSAAVVPGRGDKACAYGCLGYGSCVSVCEFDAIHIVNGVACVDKEKCRACKKCIAVCPNNLIELVPAEGVHAVKCSSKDKGKDVKAVCSTGCIGCGICVKQCEHGAVTLENNVAHINYDKCTGCGKCAAKCPQKVIV